MESRQTTVPSQPSQVSPNPPPSSPAISHQYPRAAQMSVYDAPMHHASNNTLLPATSPMIFYDNHQQDLLHTSSGTTFLNSEIQHHPGTEHDSRLTSTSKSDGCQSISMNQYFLTSELNIGADPAAAEASFTDTSVSDHVGCPTTSTPTFSC